MVVRVERVVELPASRQQVWEFISDPVKRAGAISVVEDFEILADDRALWHVELPIPVLNRQVQIETEDQQCEPPHHVEFVGRSKIAHIVGEHDLEETPDGTRLVNRFVVDGKLPGVETFFERNFGAELDNLERALREELECLP